MPDAQVPPHSHDQGPTNQRTAAATTCDLLPCCASKHVVSGQLPGSPVPDAGFMWMLTGAKTGWRESTSRAAKQRGSVARTYRCRKACSRGSCSVHPLREVALWAVLPGVQMTRLSARQGRCLTHPSGSRCFTQLSRSPSNVPTPGPAQLCKADGGLSTPAKCPSLRHQR